MTENTLLSDLNVLKEQTVEQLATYHNVEEETLIEGRTHHENFIAAQMQLIDALRLIGPKTFDDSQKWEAIQAIVTALYVLDLNSEYYEYPSRLYPNEGNGSHSVIALNDGFSYLIPGTSPNKTGHYNPLAEIDSLSEPTIKTLAEKYQVQDRLDDMRGKAHTSQIQIELATAITNLGDNPYTSLHLAQKYILSAMLLISRSHNRRTKIAVETVTDAVSTERNKDNPDMKTEQKMITISEE